MPSMRGISTSSVMTSGTSSWIRRAATNGSEAAPITSISGIGRQDRRHRLPHRGGIVDDQNADPAFHRRLRRRNTVGPTGSTGK